MTRRPDDRDPGDEDLVTRDLGGKVRRTIGKVPFTRDAVAAFYAARDPATPTGVKIAVMSALAYFIVPFDLVPDFIAALGYTDDATVFYGAWRLLAPHLKPQHETKAREFLLQEVKDDAPPKD
ncbi:MAG: YkvA family protein [Alphaproteobacteria bacterium]